jgi:hypothetical protein
MGRRPERLRRTPIRDPRPALRAAPVLGLSLILLVGGWSALWLFARYEAERTFHAWLEGEHAYGRAWTCPNERVGGYPLGIVLSCDHPTFRGPVADGLFAGKLGQLRAETKLYFPTNVAVHLGSPLRATEVDGSRRLDVAWSSALLTLRGVLPNNLDRGELDLNDLHVGPGDAPTARIGRVLVGFKPMNRTAGPRSDLEASIDADGAAIPSLNAVLGSSDPFALSFKGFATQVGFTGGTTLPELLDPWIAAGGQLHVESLALTKGAFRMTGAGRVGLDDEHRVVGRLDTGFSGLDPVAARLGLPLGAVKVGGLLAGLLGGSSPDTSQAQPADVSLPLVAKDGRLFLGPVNTGVRLLPLY